MAITSKRSSYRLTFTVLMLGTIAYALLQSLVSPVLPTIQHELHTTQNTVTWVLTAFLLSASIFTPILGRVGDMVGKERMLVVTLAALAAGSVVAGLAHSITVLIIARAIQGIGGAVLPLSFGIVRDEFPGVKVAGAVGIIAAMAAVGGGAGIVLAGPIVSNLNYHWLFWIPMVIAAIATLCAWLFVPESPVRTPGRISWLAAVLLSAWLVALLLGVSEAPSWGWGSPKVLGLIGAAVVLAGSWVLVELRCHRAPRRHAHDAPPGGVDQQPGRLHVRHRHVLGDRLPARVRPDPEVHRLRVRRQHHPVGALPPPPDGDHVRLRPPVGPDRRHHRLQGGRHHRVDRLHRGLPPAGLRPLRGVGDLPGQHPARCRAGAGLLRHVEPDRPGRPPGPDRAWPAA